MEPHTVSHPGLFSRPIITLTILRSLQVLFKPAYMATFSTVSIFRAHFEVYFTNVIQGKKFELPA